MRKEIVSFMMPFNFIKFLTLLGIASFQKLNSGGFSIEFDYIFPSKMSEVLDTFDANVTVVILFILNLFNPNHFIQFNHMLKIFHRDFSRGGLFCVHDEIVLILIIIIVLK